MREAEADLAKSRIQLRKGPILSDIDRKKNEAKAESATARVASLNKSNESRVKAEAAAVRILELKLDRQQVMLERIQTNLERMVIKAPQVGMVALENIWREQFDWVYREYDYAVFPLTIHPDVSGKPQVLMMLERFFNHLSRHPGVKFVRMEEIADDFLKRYPRSRKARPTS